jgi:hypothetical protein
VIRRPDWRRERLGLGVGRRYPGASPNLRSQSTPSGGYGFDASGRSALIILKDILR